MNKIYFLIIQIFIFSTATACQSKNDQILDQTLEIHIDPVQESNPETLDKNSPAFVEYSEKMALAIAQKMGDRFSKTYDLAIAAIFQNEANYLKEWIEFHKLVGVKHFYLFNNLSNDNYLSVLKPYILNGDVDLIEWPFHTNEDGKNWAAIQRGSYLTAVKLVSHKVKWLALIDVDEYVIPVEGNNLPSILKDYEEFGGVGVNWQMYGTSNVARIPDNKLLTETLLFKAPRDFSENLHIKSIVRPERVQICHVHHCIYQGDFFAVETNKEKISTPRSDKVLTDKMRINHYWSKDEDFFLKTKIARRKKWQESEEAMMQRVNNCNQELDTEMLRFVPELKSKVFH